jgi:hypothetical protein
MKKSKLTKKQQRMKWAEHQACYLAAHPEQKRKKAKRAKARRRAAKKAALSVKKRGSAVSQSARKVDTHV